MSSGAGHGRGRGVGQGSTDSRSGGRMSAYHQYGALLGGVPMRPRTTMNDGNDIPLLEWGSPDAFADFKRAYLPYAQRTFGIFASFLLDGRYLNPPAIADIDESRASSAEKEDHKQQVIDRRRTIQQMQKEKIPICADIYLRLSELSKQKISEADAAYADLLEARNDPLALWHVIRLRIK